MLVPRSLMRLEPTKGGAVFRVVPQAERPERLRASDNDLRLQSICNQEQAVRVIALQPEQPGLQRGRLS